MGRRAKILVLLVPVTAVLLLIWLTCRMSRPAVLDDYGDLRVERRKIFDEKNLRVLLEETAGLLPKHARTSNWSRVSSDTFCGVWDDARVAAIFSDSAAARAHFWKELPRRESFVFAADKDAEGFWPAIFGGCLSAALKLEFSCALRAGDQTLCHQRLGEWLQLSDRMLREEHGGEGTLALYLSSLTLGLCEQLVHDRNSSDTWLAEWASQLPQPELLRAAAVWALKKEYGYYSAKVDDGTLYGEYLGDGSGAPPTSAGGLVALLLQHNYSAKCMKEGLASSYREAIGIALANRVPAVFFEGKWSMSDELSHAWRPNAGSLWILDCMDRGRRTVKWLKRVEATAGCLRVIIACERYRRATGAYPETLQALVPRFLERVPVDPYLDATLHYACDREIVWVVGENLKDDGGSVEMEQGGDGIYRASRPTYALDFVYPVSSNAFAKAAELAREHVEAMKRRH